MPIDKAVFFHIYDIGTEFKPPLLISEINRIDADKKEWFLLFVEIRSNKKNMQKSLEIKRKL